MNGPARPRGPNARTVRVSTVTETDMLESGAPWGQACVTPLGRFPFSAQLVEIDLGDMVLEIGRNRPVAVVGRLAAGCAGLLMPLEGYGRLILGGRIAEPEFIAVCGPGAAFEGASRGRVAWASLTLKTAAVGSLFPPARSAILRPGHFGVLRVNPVAWQRAITVIRQVEPVARDQPEVFEVPEARRSLRSSVLEMAHELLAGPHEAPPSRPVALATVRQRLLIHAAVQAVQADPAHLRGEASLAAALGISALRVRRAFATILGVSPSRYLLLRRLVMVRTALHAAHPPLEALARAHGFPRFDRFLRCYAEVFGDVPSHT
jgi:AraC-like DNA-binding protein